MIKPYPPLLLSFLCLFMSGCEMIDYHPYDVRINGETDVNAHNIAEIEQKCKDKTTIKFVTMGDSQRWYDETLDFVGEILRAVRQRQPETGTTRQSCRSEERS